MEYYKELTYNFWKPLFMKFIKNLFYIYLHIWKYAKVIKP